MYAYSNSGGNGPPHSAQVQTNGSITMQLRWVTYGDDDNPNAAIAANPPARQWVAISSSAYWSASSGSGMTPSGQCSDGQGDEMVTAPGSGIASGTHLRQFDGSSGVITVPISLSASSSVVNTSSSQAACSASVSASMAPTDRGVTITSNFDTTNDRDTSTNPPTPKPCLPDAAGVIHAHTLAGLPTNWNPFTSILFGGYTANIIGSWGDGTEYHWYSSLTGYWSQGTFSGTGPIPYLEVPYRNGPATPGTTDHVYVHLIDSQNGIQADNYYHLTFHAKYDDWNRTQFVHYPRPIETYVGDWNYIFTLDNPSSAPLVAAATHSITLTDTMTGAIESSQSLDAWGLDIFSVKESITVGRSVSVQTTTSQTFTANPWTRSEIYGGLSKEDRWGTCSVWGTGGYSNDSNWYGHYCTESVSYGQVEVIHYLSSLTSL